MTGNSDASGTENRLDNWRTDGWKYRATETVFATRHDAVGAAAVAAREERDRREDNVPSWAPVPTVMGWTSYTHAFKPYHCGYCHETFLTEAEYEEHQTCPHYEPTEGRRGSNPVEAAHMARRSR